jgi:hypothetical protein
MGAQLVVQGSDPIQAAQALGLPGDPTALTLGQLNQLIAYRTLIRSPRSLNVLVKAPRAILSMNVPSKMESIRVHWLKTAKCPPIFTPVTPERSSSRPG